MKHRGGLNRKALPAYIERVLSAKAELGDVTQVVVAHASDCPRLSGGACACQPDVTVHRPDGRVVDVDVDGQCGAEVRPS